MSAYNRILDIQLEASRRVALQRQIDLTRRLQIQKLQQQRQLHYLKQNQKALAQRDYHQHKIKRAYQHKVAQQEAINNRLIRQAASRQYQARTIQQRLARQYKDQCLQKQMRVNQQQQIIRAQLIASKRRVHLQNRQTLKSQLDRQNIAILQQQQNQQKLQKQLAAIQIQIGMINDKQKQRKRKQLQQLQQLDKQSFKLKQAMRSSKVQQKLLQQSIAELSKIIV